MPATMDSMREISRPPLLPRPVDAHKGQFGHLLVIGGSVGLAGAPRLAASAAAVSGVGLVTLLVPTPVRAEAASDPALMVLGAPATAAGTLSWAGLAAVRMAVAGRTAVVIGPGAGRHPGTDALLCQIVAEVPQPMVCDADALNAWAEASNPAPSAPRVFTPHPGEAARLLQTTSDEVQADRPAAALALRARLGGVVVLKGAETLVTEGDEVYRNPTGHPGLATGGSGDVLAGLIGSLLAQGLSPLEAACAGAWIHGRASDELRPSTGERGLTPGALIERLPLSFAALER